MLAAVRTLPFWTTLGSAIPRPAPGSDIPRDSPAITSITPAGVAGCGVRADISSPTSRPASTSTSPAFTDDPPTSKPCILRVMTNNSQICRCGQLLVALATPALVTHPHRRGDDAERDQHHHDRRQRIHVRTHTETHLRENDHRQRARAGTCDKLRDNEIIPRQCERQEPAGQNRRHDQRKRNTEKHRDWTRAQGPPRLFQRFIESHQSRLYHHRHVSHAEGNVRK